MQNVSNSDIKCKQFNKTAAAHSSGNLWILHLFLTYFLKLLRSDIRVDVSVEKVILIAWTVDSSTNLFLFFLRISTWLAAEDEEQYKYDETESA